MACKLTANITKENCQYQVAGIKEVYLMNYDTRPKFEFEDSDKRVVNNITFDGTEKMYKVDFIEGTSSFTDDLAVNGNGGKYRTQTVNFTVSNYEHENLMQGDALSLGKFIAIVVDKSKRAIMLGHDNGLSATSFNYASGAADADAMGWTTVLAGTQLSIAKLVDVDTIDLSTLISPSMIVTP